MHSVLKWFVLLAYLGAYSTHMLAFQLLLCLLSYLCQSLTSLTLRNFQLGWLYSGIYGKWISRTLPSKSLIWLFRKTSRNTLHCANSWDILKENWWRGKQDQHHFSRRLQLTKLFPQTWLLIFCLMGFWKLFNWRWFGKLFTHFQPLLETQTESRQNCILY